MSHKMTALDAQHAWYAELPWHRLGNVGPIDWEDARDAFDWCEVQRHPIHIEHDEILGDCTLPGSAFFPHGFLGSLDLVPRGPEAAKQRSEGRVKRHLR